MKKVIVTGGRYFNDREAVFIILDILDPDIVIEGGAPGADKLAHDWACLRGKKSHTYVADWDTHGKAAGPIRNNLMLSENRDARVIAFQGGAGTQNCIAQAIKLGMEVHEILPRIDHA